MEDLEMKKAMIGIGIVLLVAVLTVPVFGHGPGWSRGLGAGGCVGQGYGAHQFDNGRVAGRAGLDLTDQQSATIGTLRDNHRKTITPMRADMQVKRAELNALWVKPNPDQDTILAKEKELSVLRDQIREKRTIHRLEIYKVLTPEQREKLSYYRSVTGKKAHGDFGNRYCDGQDFRRGHRSGGCKNGGYRGWQ